MTTMETKRRPRVERARQVADVLRSEVLHGRVPLGGLPSEAELGAEFGVSRNTVREAIEMLRDEGLVVRCPGVGTLVSATKYDHGIDRLMGLAETLHEHGPVVNEVRTTSLVDPPKTVAERLDLRQGESVVYLERRRLLNGRPVSLDLTYLVRDLGEPLVAHDLAHSDIFALLEQIAGTSLGHAELTLEAVAADAHSAAILDTPRGSPLFMLERLTHLDGGRPVDLEFVRFRGDQVTMRGNIRRTSPQEGAPR
ncbi:MAG: GntR family transcriptional regulator [Nocardioidaceae bacterium]